MRLREFDWWPPALTDSYTSQVVPSAPLPATLKRCGVYSMAGAPAPYLSIVVDYQGRAWHAMVKDMQESLMRRIEATLRGHDGEPLADLGELDIVENP